ncbi:MAG: cytochrome c [Bryobacterales bacterium]|nr:cytochrome c [Bryobacterales bacterium]
MSTSRMLRIPRGAAARDGSLTVPTPSTFPGRMHKPPAVPGPPKLTPAEQREFVARFCGSQCHGMDVIEGRRQTKQQWQATVNAMVARGARGSKAELNLVVDYLTNRFGPTQR